LKIIFAEGVPLALTLKLDSMKSNTEMARTAFRYCGGIAALFILFSGKLTAQETKIEERPAVQVTYQQEESNFLVFKVTVSSPGNKKSILKVSDRNSELLYSETITSDSYAKTIRIPKYNDLDMIEFKVSNGKDVLKRSFDVKFVTKESLEVISSDR